MLPSPAPYTWFTTTHRCDRAHLRVAVLGVERQVVFQFLHVLAEEVQLRGFPGVAHVHIGLEGGLVAEQLVVIGFVGADGDVDRGVQVHPGEVGRQVVVGEESVGAQVQEFLERGIVGGVGGFLQQLRQLQQFAAVFVGIIHDGVLPGALAVLGVTDGREEPLGLVLVFRIQAAHPALDGCLGRPVRIEIGAGRLFGRDRDAGVLGRHEGTVAVDDRPRSLVQPEVIAARLAQRRAVFLQRRPHRLVAGPALAQLQGVDDLGGLDQPGDGDAVAAGELAGVGAQVDRREALGHRVQFGDGGRCGS
jgi:hypothetical protein